MASPHMPPIRMAHRRREHMKENNKNEMVLTATHYYDTARFSRYEIDAGQAVTGRIYVRKDQEAERVTIILGKKREEDAQGKQTNTMAKKG